MQNEGRTIILVTHDSNTVQTFCDSAVMLDHGKLISLGDPIEVINTYSKLP